MPLVAGVAVWTLLCMSAADWLVFRGSDDSLKYRNVLRGKAASSVLLVINHGVGQGGYGLWLARRTGIGGRRTFGLIAYVMASDLTALFSVAGLAAWLSDIDATTLVNVELVRVVAPLAALSMIAAAFLGPRLLPRLIPQARVFKPWLTIGVGTFVMSLCLRSLSLLGVMLVTWLSARTFGLSIPLGAFLAYLPIIFLAASLPINVFGFGPVQLVWVAAFEAWAAAEEILAFQFVFHILGVAAFLCRGVPFLPSVLAEIEAGKPERTADGEDAK